MLIARTFVIVILVVSTFSQVTKVIKNNPLLSRKKRYLTFPTNSNFVITLSFIKALLQTQPKGWNILGECDVPFPLPSDTRFFKKDPLIHQLQRREVLRRLENAFSQEGLNGSACVKRMVCEARQHLNSEDKSLVRDIVSTIFISSSETDSEINYEEFCSGTVFAECEVSFLTYILSSLFKT